MSEIRILQSIKKLKEKISSVDEKVNDLAKIKNKDGIGIKNAEIDEDGHLIITLTDKREIDCGLVKGKDGKDGLNVKPLIGIGIKNVEVKDNVLFVTMTDNKVINAGKINTGGGEGGTTNYEMLSNLPKLNGKTLIGDTKIDIPDISNLATKDEIPDISGLAKKEEIPDISNLATKEEIPIKNSSLENDSKFITIEDIPDIPSKTSQLENDSDFVSDANYIHTDNNFDSQTKQKIQTNSNNIANLMTEVPKKQDKLIAGNNITIVDNVISSQGGSGENIQYEIMPIASEENENQIVQYVGDTNEEYHNGYWYKCVNKSEYILNTIHSDYLNKDFTEEDILNDVKSKFPDIDLEKYKDIYITNSKYLFVVVLQEKGNYSLNYYKDGEFSAYSTGYAQRYYMSYEKSGSISADFAVNRGYSVGSSSVTNFDLLDDKSLVTPEELEEINKKIKILNFPPKKITVLDWERIDVQPKEEIPSLDDYATKEWVEDKNYLTEHQDISTKYDKTGGEITGNVKIDGSLTFDIEDEDYDAGVRINQSLDNNRGTVLTFTGYANGQENTNYKPIISNIGTPIYNYDVANKKYVDDKVATVWISGFLDDTGLLLGSGAYDTSYNGVTENKQCYIKITQTDRVRIFKLKTWKNFNDHKAGNDEFLYEELNDINTSAVISVKKTENTYNEVNLEFIENKKTSVDDNKDSDTYYPTTKAVYEAKESLREWVIEGYKKKDVLIYDKNEKLKVDGTLNTTYDTDNGLKATGENGYTSLYNITGLDLSKFSSIRVVIARDETNTGNTAEFNIPLEYPIQNKKTGIGAIDYGTQYVSGIAVPSYGDRNRLNCCQASVSVPIDGSLENCNFSVCQTFSLYGTAATTISSLYVVKIYGIYKGF